MNFYERNKNRKLEENVIDIENNKKSYMKPLLFGGDVPSNLFFFCFFAGACDSIRFLANAAGEKYLLEELPPKMYFGS